MDSFKILYYFNSTLNQHLFRLFRGSLRYTVGVHLYLWHNFVVFIFYFLHTFTRPTHPHPNTHTLGYTQITRLEEGVNEGLCDVFDCGMQENVRWAKALQMHLFLFFK